MSLSSSFSSSETMIDFKEMMLCVFLWALFSIVALHSMAAAYSFYTWRKHPVGRWYSAFILLFGMLASLISGAITSAVFSGVFVSLGWTMTYWVALMIGVGHTVVGVCVSFTRFPATL